MDLCVIRYDIGINMLLPCAGMEQLLPGQLVMADGRLAGGGGEPVRQPGGGLGVDVRVAGWVEFEHVVAVDQHRVAADQFHQRAPVAEGEPGAAIGEGDGVQGRSHVEGRPHAAADFLVPGRGRGKLGLAPEALFHRIGAAGIPATNAAVVAGILAGLASMAVCCVAAHTHTASRQEFKAVASAFHCAFVLFR